jgi:tripartite motif-containing protein 71
MLALPRPASVPRPGWLGLALVMFIAGCGSSAPTLQPPTPTPVPTPTPSAAAASATHPPAPTSTPAPPVVAPASLPPLLPALQLAWQAHGPVGQQTSTAASAIDPLTGDLWVGVPFEDKFWIISPDGKYLASWGMPGKGPGQFDFSDHVQDPDGWAPIAFAPDGSFVVGDTGNDRVQLFDAERHFVRQWGSFGTDDGEFVQITSVGTDGKTIYVGDGERWDIQAFSRDGTFIRAFGGDGRFWVVSVAADGSVRASNGDPSNAAGTPWGIAAFAPDGSQSWRTDLSALGGMTAWVAIDSRGNTYTTIEQPGEPYAALALVELDPTGQVLRTWGDTGGDAITVDPAGHAVYVTRGVQLDGNQWTAVRKYAIPTG